MTIWNILWIFLIFYDYSVHFVFIWYILSSFGIMHQEKSGNPALATQIPEDGDLGFCSRRTVLIQY
jgi:hypothetical protein